MFSTRMIWASPLSKVNSEQSSLYKPLDKSSLIFGETESLTSAVSTIKMASASSVKKKESNKLAAK